jgi:hypothetical protein
MRNRYTIPGNDQIPAIATIGNNISQIVPAPAAS